MATVNRHGKGWRAQIRRQGHKPLSKTFRTKGQAWSWAELTERAILEGRAGILPKHTLKEALERFAREVSPKHKGERWERVRLLKMGRRPMAGKIIHQVSTTDLSAERDARLEEVSAGTVRREMGLLGQVFDIARREWKWISVNPMADVKKPPPPKPKPRPMPQAAIGDMVDELWGTPAGREVAMAFLLGIESAMRPWEMMSLERPQIDLATRVARLEETKNGDEREVPLSTVAADILEVLLATNPGPRVFSISAGTVTTLWGEARKRTPYAGLHFRHSRREGIRRLSKKLDILELARTVGHRDLKSLMIYYSASASELAQKLG
jgi:integrase